MVCCNVFRAMTIEEIAELKNESKKSEEFTGVLAVSKPSSINCNTRSRVKFFKDSSSNFSFAELALQIEKENLRIKIYCSLDFSYLGSPNLCADLIELCSVDIYSVLRSQGTLR